jgi:hypothetical protein
MREDGVLGAILPEATRLDRLERGIALSALTPLLRLAALIEVDRAGATALAERLRLSSAERKRLEGLAPPWGIDPAGDAKSQRLSLYRLGRARFCDVAMLLAADGRLAPARLRRLVDLAGTWPIPDFPLGGADVTALGIPPGPRVGRLLAAVRRWWEEGDFGASREQCLARLREIAF